MKGQAAMEFLMTYGWALLIVLVAIGVLATFGVFSGRGVGEACLLGPGLACTSKIVYKQVSPQISERFEMMIVNGFGKDMDELFITINPRGQRCPGITGYVASLKFFQLYPLFSDPAGNPVRSSFPDGATLPLQSPSIPNLSPPPAIIPGHLGANCTDDVANCCRGYNAALSLLPPAFSVPCSPSLPDVCVGPENAPNRMPPPGSRFKEDVFVTYRFGDSSLIHSRVGTLMGIVEIQ